MNYKKVSISFIFTLILLTSWYQARAQGSQDILVQYLSELQQNPIDAALRERVIKHVQTMKSRPGISEEAKKHMSRGMAAIEAAKTEADYKDAAAEFEKLVNLAPWLSEGYRNLGIAQDKAGQYDAAIRNLNFYLLTGPVDASKAKDLIYKIEYHKEKAQREAKEAEKKAGLQLEGTFWDMNLYWEDGRHLSRSELIFKPGGSAITVTESGVRSDYTWEIIGNRVFLKNSIRTGEYTATSQFNGTIVSDYIEGTVLVNLIGPNSSSHRYKWSAKKKRQE